MTDVAMHMYGITYRDDDGVTEVVDAHRVEGWTNDYAVFSHPTALDIPTLIIPRDRVKQVRMLMDGSGEVIIPSADEFESRSVFEEAESVLRNIDASLQERIEAANNLRDYFESSS